MSLLHDVLKNTLDPSYEAAKRRRLAAGGGADRGSSGRSPLTVIAFTLIGLFFGVAWQLTHLAEPAGSIARQRLLTEIAEQDADVAQLQRTNSDLGRKISNLRTSFLQLNSRDGLAQQVLNLSAAAGATEVRGPGMVVSVEDSTEVDPPAEANPRAIRPMQEGRVIDQDLQFVVNGLWLAGAEAIAINDQRITAKSSIRSVGSAILVDYRPLLPPYAVSAIGDPATLEDRFNAGPGGQDVQFLKDNFGLRVSVRALGSLRLPAAPGLDVRLANLTPTTDLGPRTERAN